ncbi:MAG TPA: hypothetical protein VFG35_08845 [Actinoplanes sp.]|nr:hypothetical protein [Actinoplanes sp.]
MRTLADRHVDTTVLDAAALVALVVGGRSAQRAGSGGGKPPGIAVPVPVGALAQRGRDGSS